MLCQVPKILNIYIIFDLVAGWGMLFFSKNTRAPANFLDPFVFLCMYVYDLFRQTRKKKRTSIHACMYAHIHTHIHASFTHEIYTRLNRKQNGVINTLACQDRHHSVIALYFCVMSAYIYIIASHLHIQGGYDS